MIKKNRWPRRNCVGKSFCNQSHQTISRTDDVTLSLSLSLSLSLYRFQIFSCQSHIYVPAASQRSKIALPDRESSSRVVVVRYFCFYSAAAASDTCVLIESISLHCHRERGRNRSLRGMRQGGRLKTIDLDQMFLVWVVGRERNGRKRLGCR
jgi:hypothetical protein